MRRFPVEPLPPPQEIADLEKPDDEDITLKWNDMMSKSKEKATDQLKDWQEKLNAFNKKVPKPDTKHVEIIREDNTIPHIDLKGQKKTKKKEIVADNEPSLSDLLAEGFAEEQKANAEKEEADELEHISKEDKEEGIPVWEGDLKQEPTISEEIEKVMEPERTRPDFTEVLEPEKAVQDMMKDPKKAVEDNLRIESNTAKRGALGQIVVKDKNKKVVDKIDPITPKDDYVQNEEQTNKTIWNKIKNKLTTTEEEYRVRVEKRIEDLMTQLDDGKITLEDLTPEDRQVIINIRMQNESGSNI